MSTTPATCTPEKNFRALWIRGDSRGFTVTPCEVIGLFPETKAAVIAYGFNSTGQMLVPMAQLASYPERAEAICAGFIAQLLAGNAAPAKMPAPVSDTKGAAA